MTGGDLSDVLQQLKIVDAQARAGEEVSGKEQEIPLTRGLHDSTQQPPDSTPRGRALRSKQPELLPDEDGDSSSGAALAARGDRRFPKGLPSPRKCPSRCFIDGGL